MEPRDLRNACLNITGEGLWGFMWNLIAPATVMTVLLRQHGAGERLIASIATIESACCLLPQLLGVYVFHSRRRRKVMLVFWHMLVILPFILAGGLLTWHADALRPQPYCLLMLAIYAGFNLATGVVVAAWMDFMGHIFPVAVRGKVLGLSMAAFSVAGTLGALLAGRLIRAEDAGARPFAWLYLMAWVIGSVSITLWLLVRDPAEEETHAPPRPGLAELAARFRDSLADANFRSFLVSRVLATCGFCILPLVALYYTSTAGGALSGSFVVSAFAAQTVCTAVGSAALGWLGDRHGHRVGVLLGTGAQVVLLAVLLFVPGRTGCILVYAVSGLCAACGFVSHYNLILESCPHDNRVVHISVANLLIGVPLAVVPLVAGQVAAWYGMRVVFAGSLVLSLAAVLWVALRVREPRTLKVYTEEV